MIKKEKINFIFNLPLIFAGYSNLNKNKKTGK